jgi:hypothetical protein
MIEPLKFLERNILRIDRAEPLLTYVPLPAPSASAAESPSKLRKYSALGEAYLDEDGSRVYDGEEEREEEEDTWRPFMANPRPQSRQHRDSEVRVCVCVCV